MTFDYAGQWTPWRRCLAKQDPGVPLEERNPWPGYWRQSMHVGGGKYAYRGVAFWREENGYPWAIIGSHVFEGPAALEQMEPVWKWCEQPITKAAFDKWRETGEWADLDPAVAAFLRGLREGRPGIGHNEPPQDALTVIREQLESARESVANYAKITSLEMFQAAQSLVARLKELGREANKAREKEKRPHLDKCQEIDKRYKPTIDAAQAEWLTVERAMNVWATEEAMRVAAERQRIEDERREREAERARLEAEARERDVTLPQTMPEPEPEPELPTEITSVKGAYGRAAPIRVVKEIAEITDWLALASHYIENPKLRETLKTLAARDINNGHTVPGIRVEEVRRVSRRTA